jgi:hypothetical protein
MCYSVKTPPACARRWVERDSVEIFYAVIEPGAANESVEDHAAGVMPWTVVANVNAADPSERSGPRRRP